MENHRANQRLAQRARRMIATESVNHGVDPPNLMGRPEWKVTKPPDAKPPSEMTVTHINQTYKIFGPFSLDGIGKFQTEAEKYANTGQADDQDSEEWLQTHNIHHLKLTLKDLVDKGTVGKPICDKHTGKVKQHIQFDAATINEFEYKLHKLIASYTERIKWCLAGSKRTFGLIKGNRVAVLLDISDANTGFGRMTAYKESLMHLIDEQLSKKEKLYFVTYGTTVNSLWKVPRDVNCRIVGEAEDFVRQLQPGGGCNLMRALRHIFSVKDIDSVVLCLGAVPDQKNEFLCDYVYQLTCASTYPLHCVTYDSANEDTVHTLKNLAEVTGGRYHCFTSTNEDEIYSGDDISALLKEVKEAQDIINKIKDMRKGLMGTALVSIMDEITNEVAKLPQSRFLPRPPGHDSPLDLTQPTFNPKTSNEWLRANGLKAKNLEIYQVISKHAYASKEDFVPVLGKTVKSQVNNSALTKFVWHDGSVRNVHVDMSELFEYQKHLGSVVEVFENRVNWLSQGSKRIFGTVTEKIVVIMVDLSIMNLNYLVHIQHSLRLLLEQQLVNKEYLNIITFGIHVKKWKPTVTKITPQSLQDAWKFCLDMQCEGSRNFMEAFRQAAENDDETHHNVNIEGIYLFTSGIPDQHSDQCVAYVEESLKGRGCKIHTILFNVDDYDSNGAIAGRWSNITATADLYRTMAHCTGGRFHWFRETGEYDKDGIIESDDIKAITDEIDRAVSFSNQASSLVDSVRGKYKGSNKGGTSKAGSSLATQSKLGGSSTSVTTSASGTDYQRPRSSLSYSRHGIGYHSDCIPPKALMWPEWPTAPETPNVQLKALTALPLSARQLSNRDQEEPNSIRRPKSATTRSITSRTSKHTRASSARESSRKDEDPMAKVKSSYKKQPSQQAFYTGHKNQVGLVFKDYPSSKSVRKAVIPASIPNNEESIPTREWMKKYSITKLRLDLFKLVSGPDCKHVDQNVKALGKNVDARYCHIFPSVNIKGTIKHLQLLPHELEQYEVQMDLVLKRYVKRLQWLLSGSRRIFGSIVESKVAILVDVSGSMTSHIDELKQELASLIWDQLYPQKVKFNLMGFSKKVVKWMTKATPATEQRCHEAIEWISQLSAEGNTCTLEALQSAFCDLELEGIYLLSDGKPDTSTQHVLKEVAKMNEHRKLRVHTMSFHCDDKSANSFLKMLAAETGGRYHRNHGDFNADLFAHKVLQHGFTDETTRIPDFEGDDLRRLASEIALARKYIQQAKVFREQYNSKSVGTQDNTIGREVQATA